MTEESQENQRPALTALVDLLEKMSVCELLAEWHGGGDEGELSGVACRDAADELMEELPEEIDETLYAALQEAADEHGFNYYDGEGGYLALTVDVPGRFATWAAQVPAYEEDDEHSGGYMV